MAEHIVILKLGRQNNSLKFPRHILFPTYSLKCFPFFSLCFPVTHFFFLSPTFSYALNFPVHCLNPSFYTIMFVIHFHNYQKLLLLFSPLSALYCFSFIFASHYSFSFILFIVFLPSHSLCLFPSTSLSLTLTSSISHTN